MLDSDRLTMLEARISNMDLRTDKIIVYIEKGMEFRETTASSLAVIMDNLKDFKDYQDKCEEDRKNLDKRVSANEGFKKTVVKISGCTGGFLVFLVMGGSKFVEHLITLFN